MGFRITDSGSFVEVALEGFVTLEEACVHFRQLLKIVGAQRQRSGRARVIVNTINALLQSGEVASFLSDTTAKLYSDMDRVAVVVSSSLLRMQIKRVLTARSFPTFTDAAEAVAYVTT